MALLLEQAADQLRRGMAGTVRGFDPAAALEPWGATPPPAGPTPWFGFDARQSTAVLAGNDSPGYDYVGSVTDAAGGPVVMTPSGGSIFLGPAEAAHGNLRPLYTPNAAHLLSSIDFPVSGNAGRSFLAVLKVPNARANVFGHGNVNANGNLYDALVQVGTPPTLGMHVAGNDPQLGGQAAPFTPDQYMLVSVRYNPATEQEIVRVNNAWAVTTVTPTTAASKLFLLGGGFTPFNGNTPRWLLYGFAYPLWLTDEEDATERAALATAFNLP